MEVHVVEGGVDTHDFKDPIQYMNIIFIHILVIVIVTSEGYNLKLRLVFLFIFFIQKNRSFSMQVMFYLQHDHCQRA